MAPPSLPKSSSMCAGARACRPGRAGRKSVTVVDGNGLVKEKRTLLHGSEMASKWLQNWLQLFNDRLQNGFKIGFNWLQLFNDRQSV